MHGIAASFAGLIFSELGAEVLKVENSRSGDHARGWGPPFWDGTACAFRAYHRGKQGLTVDFADPVAVARVATPLRRDSAGDVMADARSGRARRPTGGGERE